MNDPHVIPGIDSHTCDCANEPVIRQRLRPEGINFEIRNLPRVLCHKDRRTCQQKYSELFDLSHIRCDSTPPGSLMVLPEEERVISLSVIRPARSCRPGSDCFLHRPVPGATTSDEASFRMSATRAA